MLEVIIALSLAILLGNILAHKIRITPAIVLIFIGLAIGIMPAHELHEVQSIGLPPHVILEDLPAHHALLGSPQHLMA